MSLLELFRQELTLDEAIRKSIELADLITQDYSPNLVVAIAAGGVLPASEISKRINVDYFKLVIRRNINLRQMYESVPRVLKPFVKLYPGYLFMTTDPSLVNAGDFTCEGMSVLLVDDTIHKGKTLKLAINNLKQRGAKQIKSAAINCVDGVLPDYFIMKGRIKFPWSKNSPDYQKFLSYTSRVSEYKTSLGFQPSISLHAP